MPPTACRRSKYRGSLPAPDDVDRTTYFLDVELQGLSPEEIKNYEIQKQVILPVQFIEDSNYVQSEFSLVDSEGSTNFISQELGDRFQSKASKIKPVVAKTANSERTYIDTIVRTKIRVHFQTGPKELMFTASVASNLHYQIY
ncbi:hypothetical protein BVG19_g3300 [[Candida] boidinii]|nr:hypothetical protein BVG19_g3300 [[Candida] boidinii]OWB52159.1 hypothetical protein B5S27_g3731 [[Candida] boidinii]OWB86750.1 hypothetical protein B5S33_g5462 [[Candida] boidinii]